jgi:hypothetical protein
MNDSILTRYGVHDYILPLKGIVHTLHFGQTKPLMFSTIPIIGTLTFLQKFISFLTSSNETSYEQVWIKIDI